MRRVPKPTNISASWDGTKCIETRARNARTKEGNGEFLKRIVCCLMSGWLAGWFLAGREEQKKKMIALSNYEVFFSSLGDSTDKRRMDPVKSARRNFEECNSIGFVVVQLQKLMS